MGSPEAFFAALEKSKTSEPRKRLKVLRMHVSDKAWVERPWLDRGLTLQGDEALSFERNYLLLLSTEDMKGARRTRAVYSDSAFLLFQVAEGLARGR